MQRGNPIDLADRPAPTPGPVRRFSQLRVKVDANGIVAALIVTMLIAVHGLGSSDLSLTLDLRSELQGNGEIFYAAKGEPFVPQKSVPFLVPTDHGWHRHTIRLPGNAGIGKIRIDPGASPGRFSLGSVVVNTLDGEHRISPRQLRQTGGTFIQADLELLDDNEIAFESSGVDPSIEVRFEQPLSSGSGGLRSLLRLLIASLAGYFGWMFFSRLGKVCMARSGIWLDRIGRCFSDDGLLVFDRRIVVAFASILAVGTLYVCLNLNQSSVGIWESVFPNRPVQQPIDLGTPKRIRSDEWTVQTPWALNQVLNGYPRHNPNIGGESAPILAAMPLGGALGLPQLKFWGFHLFTPDRGFSWWWAYKSFGMVAAFLWMFLLLTRGNLSASLLGSTWIYASSFTQWWFSSSLPEIAIAFAIAVTGAIYALYSRRRILIAMGCALVVYAVTNLMLHLYPPAIVPLAYLGMFVLAGYSIQHSGNTGGTRQIAFRISAFGISALLLVAYAFVYYLAAESSINAVMSTVYPGKRVSISGQFPIEKVASGFFEAFRLGETRLPLKPTNGSEASSFLFLAPLVLLLVPFRRLLSRRNALLPAVMIFLVLCFSWVSIRLPGPLEPWLQAAGWQYVTSKRAVFALGIASIIACVLLLDLAMRRTSDLYPVNVRRAAVLGAAMSLAALGWWLSHLDTAFFTSGTIVAGVASSTLIAAGIAFGRPAFLVLGMAAYMMATMAVNPLMSGLSSMTGKPVLIAARMQSTLGSKWLVVGEPFFSQGLKAMGLNTFGGYIYQPDMAVVEILDPSRKYEHSWNRYARVRVVSEPAAATPMFVTTWGDQYTINLNVCGSHVRRLGITHVAYTSLVPPADLACLHELDAPEDSGVRLFALRPQP